MNLKLRQLQQQAQIIFDLWQKFGRIIDGDRYFEVIALCDRILLLLFRMETFQCLIPDTAFIDLTEAINSVRFSSKYVGQRPLLKRKQLL